ncbi:hypothetical protein WOLCODRAFT_137270 [Wolfiporia cocos MD-104 SS10]|uniref:Secreted protein n=1 Tax=Wolfiporia cocos (strain MD-104) TaxID=742152 RepID=A0A2H3JGC5_WOLCO|nr:hypothetical protein WOLCODRAFT_137270 [Wolfiporia cocos MD-104 SS10]
MLPMFFLSLIGSLVLCCLLCPSIWYSITGGDEMLDAHEAGLALVAARTPFRETGPPACMAKLIMMRHKINQDKSRRRKSISRARQAPHSYSIPSVRQSREVPWVRWGRMRGKQYY